MAKRTTKRAPRGSRAARQAAGGITIAALEARARELESHAAKLRKVLDQLRTLAAVDLGDVPLVAGLPTLVATPTGRRRGAAAVALAILKEAGRPMRAGEILPEVQRRGVVVGGQKPAATLASTLLKYPGITRAGRGLFIPTEGAAAAPAKAKPGRKPGRKKAAAKAGAAKPAKKKRAKKKAVKKKAAKKAAAKKPRKKRAAKKKAAAKKTATSKKTAKSAGA